MSTIGTYFGGLEARSIENLNTDDNVLIIRNENEKQQQQQVPAMIDIRETSSPKPTQIAKSQYEKIIQEAESLFAEEQPEMIDLDQSLESVKYESRNKSDSIVSNTSDSLGSMQRFERPSKNELKKFQLEKQSKQKTDYFYEENTDSTTSNNNLLDKTINEDTTYDAKSSENNLNSNTSSANKKSSLEEERVVSKNKKLEEEEEDGTDVSDDEKQLFTNELSVETKPRNLPLRRESFEMAQRSSKSNSTSSSSSSSFGSNQIIIKPPLTEPTVTNKRMLSQIKPNLPNEQALDEATSSEKLNKLIEESKLVETLQVNQSESDSSSSDATSSVLRRNYEILRKKTSEKLMTPSPEPQEVQAAAEQITRLPIHIKPAPTKPSRIKIVKKQKASGAQAQSKFRSVSPGLLRGPDIIETIETTTSMSFIMNKNVNLITEEKREQPATSKMTSAISQPQLYQKDDLDYIKSTPIPITVQSRSKSEPKLDKQKPVHVNRISIPVNTCESPRNRVTFHKYDSNEILAVVNMPPESYETTTVESAVNRHPKKTSSHYKSEPNLMSKLDSWRKWPEYAVDQETDYSILSNNDSPCWVKENFMPKHESKVIFRNKEPRRKNQDLEFEIEIEKSACPSKTTTSVSIDGQPLKAKVFTNKDGRVSIENVSYLPGNEIVIKSDYNYNNNTGRYSTHSMINNTTVTTVTEETTATRMSSGYFSGDEFRSYHYLNSNCLDFMPNSSFTNTININQFSPTVSTSTEAPVTSNNHQFNRNKFLNNKSKQTDAIDEFNKLYKSIGLEEDDALLDRANARDHPLHGRIISRSDSPNLNTSNTSIRKIISNETTRPKSIYARKAVVHDPLKDDMARRTYLKNHVNSLSSCQLEREIQANQAYLNKCNLDSTNLSNYSSYSHLKEPDLERDDASVLNTNRKRSNSMSSLNNPDTINGSSSANNPLLILPSPTSADYLRNRTRESALLNVVMNPVRTSSDFEIGQILYDDMAYRQLRKDSDAFKLGQLKQANNNNSIPINLVNITTVPASYYQSSNPLSTNSVKTVKMLKQKDRNLKSKVNSASNLYESANR